MVHTAFVVVNYNKQKNAPCVINFEKYREKELILSRFISGEITTNGLQVRKSIMIYFDVNQIVKLEIYKIS